MPDPVSGAAAALSSKRSFSRCRLLVTLDDLGGSASLNELAHACGWDLHRLRAVVFGDEGDAKDFSVELSPFALGQVLYFESPDAAVLVLTDAGRDEVRQLRAEPHWSRGRGRRHHG